MNELNRCLEDRPEAKVFRVHSDVFTDAQPRDQKSRSCWRDWRRLMQAGFAANNSH